ncbi:MAG: 3-keto-disaccharide hydrolase [Limisphaerales bacterium]
MNTNTSWRLTVTVFSGIVAGAFNLQPVCLAQPDPHWLEHDRRRPQPPVIDPGTASTPEQAGKAPSDAVVLFDGKDLSHWADMDGNPTKWIVKDNNMECVPGSGYARTLQNFGDCQLHVEWATPTPAHGEGQGRGNSGVFFGMGRYEIQVLDSYHNLTYADGSAGAIYGQYPPLVNACRPPGEWQTYDILYTAPRFDANRKLLSPARLTIFQNGVLIQNNVALTGPTSWLERAPYDFHSEKEPIALQDHGNPVRFRNVWVRELGRVGRKEFTFSNTFLDSLAGTYETSPNNAVRFTREDHQLVLNQGGVRFVLTAESPTVFFAKTTDVQCEFQNNDQGQPESVKISVGEGGSTAKKRK